MTQPATPEQLGRGLSEVIADEVLLALKIRVAKMGKVQGSVADDVFARELFALYAFAIDTSLFTRYRDLPVRSAIMAGFWARYAEDYQSTPESKRAFFLPPQESQSRFEANAMPYRRPPGYGNPT